MRTGRRLSADEQELWSRVARTVQPMRELSRRAEVDLIAADGGVGGTLPERTAQPKPPSTTGSLRSGSPLPRPGDEPRLDRQSLDATWDRRLAKGLVQPDFTIDLHGHSLDAAHSRLEHGLALALAQGARLVLLVTGRQRSQESALRGERRGAIRAKFLDWLTAGPHAGRIAAIRGAHPRHGGHGAVYIVLRRPR